MKANLLLIVLTTLLVTSCVDPEEIMLRGTVNVLVVDGILNNLAEEQTIRLSRSISDPLTGRLGVVQLTNARVIVVVDSARQIACEEINEGTYRLPSDFRGQVGHAYQLRITASDGTQYASNQQVMQAVPPILNVKSRFNPRSLFPPLNHTYTAGHDLYLDVQDDPRVRNYYRWDWKLYEKTQWCKTCVQGIYSVYGVNVTLFTGGYFNYYTYTSDNKTVFENCVYEKLPPQPGAPDRIPYYVYDYPCRSECWQIIYSYTTSLFNDAYSNGGLLTGLNVAQIPFYDHEPALVELRQSSLTADAHRFYELYQQQTQNTGGLADTPPSALAGNVHNLANTQEIVVGYFTASAVATNRYWLDRKDVTGTSLGASEGYGSELGSELFFALNLRQPSREPSPPVQPNIYLANSPPRPPTAICRPSDSTTPFKPEGWRE